jgi:hypothetical protein
MVQLTYSQRPHRPRYVVSPRGVVRPHGAGRRSWPAFPPVETRSITSSVPRPSSLAKRHGGCTSLLLQSSRFAVAGSGGAADSANSEHHLNRSCSCNSTTDLWLWPPYLWMHAQRANIRPLRHDWENTALALSGCYPPLPRAPATPPRRFAPALAPCAMAFGLSLRGFTGAP